MCGCFVNRILTRLGPDYHDADDDITTAGADMRPTASGGGAGPGRMMSVPSTFETPMASPPPRAMPTGPKSTLQPAPVPTLQGPTLFSHTRFLGLESRPSDEDEDGDHIAADRSGAGAKPASAAASKSAPVSIVPEASQAGTQQKRGFMAKLTGKTLDAPAFALGEDGFVKVCSCCGILILLI